MKVRDLVDDITILCKKKKKKFKQIKNKKIKNIHI